MINVTGALTTILIFSVILCPPEEQDQPNMKWIPTGTFTMGWDGPEGRYDERPAHRVRIDGFWIDTTEVTNAQFATFVNETGYLTTAERPIDWQELKKQVPAGTPRPKDEDLLPGSLVFTPPTSPVNQNDFTHWWRWTPGANWRHPEGPHSNIEGREDHPVVHVSWDDATAYANWAGKRLPTEAQWERAARFGHDGQRYLWGHDLTPNAKHVTNIWQGSFPNHNSGEDGFTHTAPVKSFPANDAGLYDMAGNVWEWTADQFRPDAYRTRLHELAPGECCDNPKGPTTTLDPRNPNATVSRVQKGGSFLCHPSYCSSYRPSAKTAATPDSGMSHVGFRCVMTPTMRQNQSQQTPQETTAPSN